MPATPDLLLNFARNEADKMYALYLAQPGSSQRQDLNEALDEYADATDAFRVYVESIRKKAGES